MAEWLFALVCVLDVFVCRFFCLLLFVLILTSLCWFLLDCLGLFMLVEYDSLVLMLCYGGFDVIVVVL